MIGIKISKKKFEDLTKDSTASVAAVAKQKRDKKTTATALEKKDSINAITSQKKGVSLTTVSENRKKKKDSTKIRTAENLEFDVLGIKKLERMNSFNKKNPTVKMDAALDSLGLEKNFSNRFLFTRVKAVNAMSKSEDNQRKFFSQMLSYGSVALFILLPFFTLFLKLFYIRRNYTYVEHLVFVFHVQTVFFMLFSIFFILEICSFQPSNGVFVLLFLIYLFIAMKKFFNQGYLKTFAKFILLNISFFIVASVAVIFVFLISFALL